MDDSPFPTPPHFIRNRRQLRALLIDDQVWFILSDFCRMTVTRMRSASPIA